MGFARALVVEPEVLFLDEPFSALDVLVAENLRHELLDLWQERKIPTRAILMVTHNIDEAVKMADRLLVFGANPGHIRVELPGLPRSERQAKTGARAIGRYHLSHHDQPAGGCSKLLPARGATSAGPSASPTRCCRTSVLAN